MVAAALYSKDMFYDRPDDWHARGQITCFGLALTFSVFLVPWLFVHEQRREAVARGILAPLDDDLLRRICMRSCANR